MSVDFDLTEEEVVRRLELLNELEGIEAELARRSLLYFIHKTWEYVEPETEFSENWHIQELCRLLEDVSAGKMRRLIINVPPGTMKSLLVSVFWPAWEWATKPHLRYLTASYGAHLTIRDNLRLRDIISSPWYQKHFGLEFVEDQNQKIRFNTAAGGWRIATSVGGVGTGEHPDRIIIDDPVTAEQANSSTERTRANRWFDRTTSTRGVARNVVIILIMQRLHEEDLSGHLLAREGWEWVCWPMRYETERENDPHWRPDSRDPRTEKGALLWPSLLSEKTVRQMEIDLGPYGTAGQLQQRPAPEGGGLFKREWFKIVDVAPRIARRSRGWDTAASEGKGDYTVGVRMAEAAGLYFIEDVTRDQLSPAGVDALMRQTAEFDGRAVAQRELREPGGSGKAVTNAHVKLMKGYDYEEWRVSHDKITEARPFRSQCEAGNVLLVKGDWNEVFLRELCDFPTGKHDDQVDGASCAFNTVLLLPEPMNVAPSLVNEAPNYYRAPSEDPHENEEESTYVT